MELVNEFDVAGEPASVFAACLDMPLVVKCLPGATLTRSIDAQHHEGSIQVRIGPMQMEFRGKLHILQADETSRQAQIHTQWDEARRRGNAVGTTRLSVQAHPQHPARSQVKVATTIELSGQLAQYARGVGVIQMAAGAITREFAGHLQDELARLAPPAGSEPVEAAAPPRKEPISLWRLIRQMLAHWISRGEGGARR